MTELFPPHEVAKDSPRMTWIQKHGVKTHHAPHCGDSPWCAWERSNYPDGDEKGIPNNPELCGYGMTEAEAIQDMAKINRIPMWSEEDFLKNKWISRYAVQIREDEGKRNGGKLAFSLSNPQWKTGYGATEDDAITDFVKRNGIKLWSEEGL